MSEKIDVVAELDALTERVRGEGEWPKFTKSRDAVIEYFSPSIFRIFGLQKGSWEEVFDARLDVYMEGDETPITPAEAARLTGTCRNFGMDTGDGVERCDVYTNSEGRLEYAGNDGFFHSLEEALADPDLIAFDYYGNEYGTSTLPRMAGDEGQAAKTPIAVLFVKG